MDSRIISLIQKYYGTSEISKIEISEVDKTYPVLLSNHLVMRLENSFFQNLPKKKL